MLPAEYISRMRALLGDGADAYMAAMERPPVKGIRINTLKTSASALLCDLPFETRPAATEDGFIVMGDISGNHPYHMAGLYYIQEPSAMAPASMADIWPGMRVLDMCAAPGGKATSAAARLMGKGVLIANEIVRERAKTLRFNMERMGAVNAAVTCSHPADVAAALPSWFDRVIVDAPCSGEGMFRKDASAAVEWSPAHVASCAARQREILESAHCCLAPGGRLIYATCTFSREENEDNVYAFMERHPEYELVSCKRYYPHETEGEGQFCAILSKAYTTPKVREQGEMRLKRVKSPLVSDFTNECFAKQPEGEWYLLPDGRVQLISCVFPEGLSKLRVLTAGVCAGELTEKRFVPEHPLFMAEHGGVYANTVVLQADDAALHAFLRGEAIPVDDGLRGYTAVAVSAGGQSHVLGFGKASCGQLKNHMPKGLRVLTRENV